MFGGRVEDGESPDTAIYRELMEELELKDIELTLWKSYERFHPEKQAIVLQYVYIGRITQELSSLHLHEGQAMKYFDIRSMKDVPIAFDFDRLLADFFVSNSTILSNRVSTVSALLRNPDGKVISQLRDDKTGLMFPGHWSTLGGRIEDGETPDEAVRRELIEEIEICPPMTFWRFFEHQFVSKGKTYEVDIYAYVGDIDLDIADIRLHEGQRLAYLDASDIDKLPFAYGLDHLYREFFANHDHRAGSHL